MAVLNMVEAIRSGLADEMARDERIMLLGQDIGVNGGVFRATDGLQERFGEERVVDMPLAEAVIVGSAVGLACSGLVPIPSFSSSASAARPSTRSRARWLGCAFARRAAYRCRS